MKKSLRYVLCSLLVLTAIPMLPSASVNAKKQDEAPSVADLGRGKVILRTKQLDPERFSIEIGNTLEDISGVIVRALGDEQDIVRIVAGGNKELVAKASPMRDVRATTLVTMPALKGRFKNVVRYNADETKALEILLVTRKGDVHPIKIHAQCFAQGTKATMQFVRDRCVTVTLTCGSPTNCTVTETCCGLGAVAFCADCVRCQITCPPCDFTTP